VPWLCPACDIVLNLMMMLLMRIYVMMMKIKDHPAD
jgi:hypothetical protein